MASSNKWSSGNVSGFAFITPPGVGAAVYRRVAAEEWEALRNEEQELTREMSEIGKGGE